MSAKGFIIAQEQDGGFVLAFDGSPYEMRQEFKRLALEPHTFVEVFGFDTNHGTQPRKHRRFKKNRTLEPVTETVAEEFDTEPEPYVGPEPEEQPKKKPARKRAKKKD